MVIAMPFGLEVLSRQVGSENTLTQEDFMIPPKKHGRSESALSNELLKFVTKV